MEMGFFLWGLAVGWMAQRPSEAPRMSRWKNTVIVVGATAMAVVAATYRPAPQPPPPAFTSSPPTFERPGP